MENLNVRYFAFFLQMLQEIMEYIWHSDLKCCRLVCKKFYDASLTFRIVNRENFAYGDLMKVTPYRYNFDHFMKTLYTTERSFYHYYFCNIEITAAFRDFVEKRGKDILSLEFNHCKIMYDPVSFCESINECIKMKSLELRYVSWPVCNHAATISLPVLETVDVTKIPEDMFNILLDTNVKNLHLCVCFHQLNDVICTRGSILENLKCLELLDESTDEQLMQIADNLILTTIRIECGRVTDEGFKYFVGKQRKLQTVEMTSCEFKTDEFLVAIAENLTDLKELIIESRNYVEYSFGAINQIINLTPVRRLECRVYIDTSELATTDVPVSKCLRQLSLSNVQNETHVTYIAKNFLSLTKLELTESIGVTNETLRLICQNLKHLKVLHVPYDDSFSGSQNDVPRLTFFENFNHLEISSLDVSLSDRPLETCFNLSSLRSLNVKHCKGITVKSFVAMPEIFPCLEYLIMTMLEVDGDVLLSTVSSLKRLWILEISVTKPITERFLNLLYEHSDSLHLLRLREGVFVRSWERKTFVEDTEW